MKYIVVSIEDIMYIYERFNIMSYCNTYDNVYLVYKTIRNTRVTDIRVVERIEMFGVATQRKGVLLKYLNLMKSTTVSLTYFHRALLSYKRMIIRHILLNTVLPEIF